MTKYEFYTLYLEWVSIELSDIPVTHKALERQLEIEMILDSTPWVFDDDGVVVNNDNQKVINNEAVS